MSMDAPDWVKLAVFIGATLMVAVGAIGVLTRRNPVHAALSLVLTLFGIAAHFVAMDAHFLAAVQVIVYAGAIVILFLFVIMLLGVDKAEDVKAEPLTGQRQLAAVVAVGIVGLVGAAVIVSRALLKENPPLTSLTSDAQTGVTPQIENVKELGRAIFGDYVFAFELTSVLLVVAVVGTVVLSRRQRKEVGA